MAHGPARLARIAIRAGERGNAVPSTEDRIAAVLTARARALVLALAAPTLLAGCGDGGDGPSIGSSDLVRAFAPEGYVESTCPEGLPVDAHARCFHTSGGSSTAEVLRPLTASLGREGAVVDARDCTPAPAGGLACQQVFRTTDGTVVLAAYPGLEEGFDLLIGRQVGS
ncbi:MAG TPA: hypothetical protein VGK17_22855 [Propionicimonas sp.]